MRLTEDPAGLPYKLSSRWIIPTAVEQVNHSNRCRAGGLDVNPKLKLLFYEHIIKISNWAVRILRNMLNGYTVE
jgi:hypothetical protein